MAIFSLFFFFAKVFNIRFNENNWILTSVSAFNLLHYVLVEVREEGPASHRYVLKRGIIF